jgi:hypothetical protein
MTPRRRYTDDLLDHLRARPGRALCGQCLSTAIPHIPPSQMGRLCLLLEARTDIRRHYATCRHCGARRLVVEVRTL